MSAHTPIAYTYNAAHHCYDCTRRYVMRAYALPAGAVELESRDYADDEGNVIGAVFSWDEWYNVGTGECDLLACDTCGVVLRAAHEDDCSQVGGARECNIRAELLEEIR